jgi:hypothetical protein
MSFHTKQNIVCCFLVIGSLRLLNFFFLFSIIFFHTWITTYGWWLLIYHMLIDSSQIDNLLSMFELLTMADGC